MWDLKANKLVINRDAILDEKGMLQNTQNEDKHALENHYSNEYVV